MNKIIIPSSYKWVAKNLNSSLGLNSLARVRLFMGREKNSKKGLKAWAVTGIAKTDINNFFVCRCFVGL